MCAVGKNVIPAIAVFLLILSSCKKDTLSNTDKIKGLWRMEASFWDKDSNGLDSGDEVYYVKPSDTIMWNFLISGELEYYVNNRISHSGTWGISINQTQTGKGFLLLEPDLNLDKYLYNIYTLNDDTCVIYCKKLKIFFSSVYVKWEGYILKRR